MTLTGAMIFIVILFTIVYYAVNFITMDDLKSKKEFWICLIPFARIFLSIIKAYKEL